jgi:hypothetical protein
MSALTSKISVSPVVDQLPASSLPASLGPHARSPEKARQIVEQDQYS